MLVVNTSQLSNSAVIQTTVYFLAEDEVTDFRLEDEQGNSVAYRLISSKPSRVQVLSPINLPGVLQVRRFDIEWQPEVPPMGYASYRVRAGQQGTKVADHAQLAAPVLENSRIKVEVQANGTFDVTDKQSGAIARGLGAFADAGDRGDLYVFKHAGEKEKLWDETVEWLYMCSNELYDECAYRFTWGLPAGLEAGFERRQKAVSACEFQVTLRLDKQSAHLNVRVEVNNEARDHRIRLLFPLPQKAANVWAGAQFDVIQRPWNEGLEWNRDCNAQPYWKWLAALYGQGGLAIFSKGLFEYEMLEEGNQAAVTLLRCVENINVRESISLENDIQPKGQCIGKHIFELAVRPFAGESATQLYREAELFNQGLKTKLAAVEDSRWSQGRAWVQDTKLTGTFTRPDPNENKKRLPMRNEWIRLEGNAIVSTVKWAEDGQGLIVRLFNAESDVSPVRLKLAKQPSRVVLTNLIEENQSELSLSNHEVIVELSPKKIETIKLYL